MSGIVCAIRGGPDSHSTIRKAVLLAKEKQLPLYFLYVVNVDFLTYSSYSRVDPIADDLHQMGRFILHFAQETAAAQGVPAKRMVRQGRVAEEIIGLCREVDADYTVLGKVEVQPERNVFTDEQLSTLGQKIARETGAEIVLVGKDEA